MFPKFDVIVVGGGHAGCEAARAAAVMGGQVLLITMNLQMIGAMSCNPAMGGIGKGQLVREIDALGGYSGVVSDTSMVQYRMLNMSKGPSMWSPRTQNDRQHFSQCWRQELERQQSLFFWQDSVQEIIVSRGTVHGVKTSSGAIISSKVVVLTTGTFLNGVIHIGRTQTLGGRIAEKSAIGLTESLKSFGFRTNRLKTGTPPRIDGRSIDYSRMDEQDGDENITGFSFVSNREAIKLQQLKCWITYTNSAVHNKLREGFKDSPMFNGSIEGLGPRYCPSIEDKIDRFAGRDSHQLFVEPEGRNTVEIYLNGFSTSLPERIQYEALQLVPGFEKCRMFRPGYAIEYDYFPPTQLKHTLETKQIKNLFFAGQINGTTGYEEAACQGLIAGINAYQVIAENDPFTLSRDEAYIGVLIDDLVSKGVDEPYRIFTSRAEYRTMLRQDNADLRLTRKGFSIGLASAERIDILTKKERDILEIKKYVDVIKVSPEDVNSFLQTKGSALIDSPVKLVRLLARPNVHLNDLANFISSLSELRRYQNLALEQVDIQVKYGNYIQKEQELANKIRSLESFEIPESFNYSEIVALGTEAKEKLTQVKPRTIGQASRISGVNPTDIQILTVFIGR